MRYAVHRLSLLLLVSAAGCATGASSPLDASRNDPDVGTEDSGSGEDAGVDEDAGTSECTPPCRDGDRCVDGRCVGSGEDMDSDGVDASVDCDDTDPSVGRTAERACSTECGDGTESCVDGTWGTCSAPTECSCDCEPGSTDTETNSCGACGEGEQVRTRECQSDCTWGDWGGWSECMTDAECSPGDTDSRTVDCEYCGTRTDTRSCDSATCTWTDWSTGTCTGGGDCSPGATRTGCDPCGHEVCQSDCTWGACEPKPTSECLYEGGSNWRCCATDSWQFCLSSCNWSPDCESGCSCGCP